MIKALVKIRFASFLGSIVNQLGKKSGTSNQGKKGKILLFILLYAYCAGVFAFMFGSVLDVFADFAFAMHIEWFYFTTFIIYAFILMFIFSIFITKSQLFEAKDNEILLTLPIRPRDILISRTITLLLFNYFFELIVAIPAAVIWIMQGGGNVLSWIAFIVTVLLLPFFSFALSGVVAWLLSLLTARLKNSAWITTGLYMVLFLGYFYVISDVQEYIQLIAINGVNLADTFQGILPLYWIGSAIGNGNVLHLLFSVLIYLVPFAIVFTLIMKSFVRICTVKAVAGRARSTKMQKGKTVTRSLPQTLLVREFKRLASSSTYMLNCGLGVLMSIVAVVLAAANRDMLIPMLAMLGGEELLGLIFILILSALNATCSFTAPSVSLEGKHYNLIRSLPISGKALLQAKLQMHNLIMMPTMLICSVLLLIFFPQSPLMSVGIVIVPQLFVIWTANIGLIFGVCHPVMEWSSEAVPVKQGMAVLLTMAFSSLAVILLGVASYFLLRVSPWLSIAVLTVPTLIGDILSYRYLMSGGVSRLESIEV